MLTPGGIIEANGVARTGPMGSSFGGPETSGWAKSMCSIAYGDFVEVATNSLQDTHG